MGMQTHSFTDPNFPGIKQPAINKYFDFETGRTACCKLHEVALCQQCANRALIESEHPKQRDPKYIRTCAVFKLLKEGKIKSKARALQLLEEKHGTGSNINQTLECWLNSKAMRHIAESLQ